MGFDNDQLSDTFSLLLMGCLGDSSVADHISPYLSEEILCLKGLDVANDQGPQPEPVQPAPEPVEATQRPPIEERKPAEKKLVKPKWLKM